MTTDEKLDALVASVEKLTKDVCEIKQAKKEEVYIENAPSPNHESPTKWPVHDISGTIYDKTNYVSGYMGEVNIQWDRLEKKVKAIDIDYGVYEDPIDAEKFKDCKDIIDLYSFQADFIENVLRRLEYLNACLEDSL